MSNCHFNTPENIKLATGESMSRMELKSHGQLFTASADLQKAFYTMAMPSTLNSRHAALWHYGSASVVNGLV